MNCDELQDSYELFAMGVAEDPEREEIRAHLNRGCEVCTAGMKRAIQLVAEVGSAAPSVEPSAKLRRRILASVGGDRQRSLWTPVWATAAVLLLAVAIYFGREQRSRLGGVGDEVHRLGVARGEVSARRRAAGLH